MKRENEVAVINPAGITPADVSTQYKRAVAGCLEMVRFGAMLMEVASVISRVRLRSEDGRIEGREDGLKAWLDEHCPDVNYATAMRFKSLAEGVKRACGLPEVMPMRLALPGPDGAIDVDADWAPDGKGRPVSASRLRELQAEVWELVEGKSQRQLLFSFMSPEGPKGGARPPSTKKLDPDWKHQDAVALWGLHLGWMLEDVKHGRCYLNLNAAELKAALDNLALVRDALKAAQGK